MFGVMKKDDLKMNERKRALQLPFSLDPLYDQGFFSRLDYYFAKSMERIFGETDDIVLTSAALSSCFLARGHVCVDISKLGNTIEPTDNSGEIAFQYPDRKVWMSALKNSAMVSEAPDFPLVMEDSGRLYLARYFDFQTRLTRNIIQRICFSPAPVDKQALDAFLNKTFSGEQPKAEAPQKAAVKNGVLKPFSIISGGPGTGKTFVTKAIRKICKELWASQGLDDPLIISAAPTGKAASKMTEGRTIHAVLKPGRYGAGFHYNKNNQLQADVMIIDEASMIDLALLTRLLEATPVTTRVILVGDSHQLASVQAGSVFSDICAVKRMEPYICELTYNFRSKGQSGIEALAGAINANSPDRVEQLLETKALPDVVFEPAAPGRPLEALIAPHVMAGYGPMQSAKGRASIASLDRFRILSAHNSGEFGTLQINHLCEKILRSKGNFDIQGRLFKTVIMVNSNDYQRNLFNGDTGIAIDVKGERKAFFPADNGKPVEFRYSDLPGHETAFCITVHKSQGSEFNTVLLILPDHMSPVLTRQLLYTGVTRAKEMVIILGDIALIKAAVSQDTRRYSGVAVHLGRALEKAFGPDMRSDH